MRICGLWCTRDDVSYTILIRYRLYDMHVDMPRLLYVLLKRPGPGFCARDREPRLGLLYQRAAMYSPRPPAPPSSP